MLLCLYVKSKTLRRSIAKESCLKQMNVNLVSCNPRLVCNPPSNRIVYLSGKLPTYPSPEPTFCLKSEVSINVGLGEG